jgi:hypothetical protein
MWYYLGQDQSQQGPVDEAHFQQLVSAGTIAPATLVWKEGMPNWQAFGTTSPAAPPFPGVAVTC